MVRSVLMVGILCGAMGAPSFAGEIPREFQGRWGKPSECKKKEDGLKMEKSTMSFGGGTTAQRVVLTVDAHDLHQGRAMLIVKGISGAPIVRGGPQIGDHMLLQLSDDKLQPVEVISAGKKMDTSFEPAIGHCT